jgi:hypothetical protein
MIGRTLSRCRATRFHVVRVIQHHFMQLARLPNIRPSIGRYRISVER